MKYFLLLIVLNPLIFLVSISQEKDDKYYFDLGEKYFENSKWDREYCDSAFLFFSKAIEINPQFQLAYRKRGDAKSCIKDYEGAIEDYKKAIELMPTDSLSYHHLALATTYLGDIEDATEKYLLAIKLFPNYYQLFIDLGMLQVENGNYQDAIETFSKAINIEPLNKVGLIERGKTYLYLGDTLNAEKDFNKALEIDSTDYFARYQVNEIKSKTISLRRKYNRQFCFLFENNSNLGIMFGLDKTIYNFGIHNITTLGSNMSLTWYLFHKIGMLLRLDGIGLNVGYIFSTKDIKSLINLKDAKNYNAKEFASFHPGLFGGIKYLLNNNDYDYLSLGIIIKYMDGPYKLVNNSYYHHIGSYIAPTINFRKSLFENLFSFEFSLSATNTKIKATQFVSDKTHVLKYFDGYLIYGNLFFQYFPRERLAPYFFGGYGSINLFLQFTPIFCKIDGFPLANTNYFSFGINWFFDIFFIKF